MGEALKVTSSLCCSTLADRTFVSFVAGVVDQIEVKVPRIIRGLSVSSAQRFPADYLLLHHLHNNNNRTRIQ